MKAIKMNDGTICLPRSKSLLNILMKTDYNTKLVKSFHV